MTTATLTGITSGSGACDCCGRSIKSRFAVRYADGTEATLGRKCAVKATGWVRPEAEIRLAVTAARRTEVASRFPTLSPEMVAEMAVVDSLWREDRRWIANAEAWASR